MLRLTKGGGAFKSEVTWRSNFKTSISSIPRIANATLSVKYNGRDTLEARGGSGSVQTKELGSLLS